jgi:hypothetical protein
MHATVTFVSPNIMAREPPTCCTASRTGAGDGFNGASSMVTMESKRAVNECRDKCSMQSCCSLRMKYDNREHAEGSRQQEAGSRQNTEETHFSGPAGYNRKLELLLERLKKWMQEKRLLVQFKALRCRISVIPATRG